MSTPSLAIHQPEAADARSLADQAYYRIRELIVTLDLPPGSLVSERDSHGTARARANTGAGGAARAGTRTPRRRLSRVAGCSSRAWTCATSPGSRRCASRSRATPPGSPPSGRPPPTGRRSDASSRSWRRPRGALDERKLIDLDQRIHRHIYECTHNPFLEATLNEYYVLTLRIWFLALDRVVAARRAR